METHDLSRLGAVDLAAALRSFPRRYREEIDRAARTQELPPEDVVCRPGADGTTGTDHLLDAVSTLTLVEQALTEVLRTDDPALHPGVLNPSHREWAPPSGLSLATLLEMLTDQCDDLADAIDAVPAADWSRPGHLADGPPVEAIDLAREAVRVGASNLRALAGSLAAG